MAVTPFQSKILKLLAKQRVAYGESYVAGGVALNLLLSSARRSRDIDLFHDTDTALAATVESLSAAEVDGARTATAAVIETIPAAPPAWKQAVAIWLGFFPVNLVGTALLLMVPTFADWPLALRVCVSTLIFTPIMVFWVLPWVTRMLRPWLTRPSRERG